MKRFSTLLLAATAVFSANTVAARQLSPAQALQAARQTSAAPAKARAMLRNLNNPIPVLTGQEGSDNTFFVFNNPDNKGFIVASADDVAPALLGYSDSGEFNPDSIAPALRWWLNCYSAQIAQAIKANAPVYQATPTRREPIPPITKTLWNQSAPYNDLCPEVTLNSNTSRAVTGCVATAMAQVMKVHQWPVTGVGSNSYSFNYQGQTYNESYNFEDVTFDWADMLNDYSSTYTPEQANAVATLMVSCGMAVNMNYGQSSTGGSGAVSFNAATALINHFNYDIGIEYLPRKYFTLDQWNDVIYNELANSRPVLLGGQSEEGGHEFVCDGYSTDNYFHINWGWAGLSDGYFLLSALDPPSQGIGGGSNDGFNMNQDAIIGIQPPVADSQTVPVFVLNTGFMTPSQSYSLDSDIQFGQSGQTLFYSISTASVSATLGIKLIDPDGNVSYVKSNVSGLFSPNSGTYTFLIDPANLNPGTYTVSPAFLSHGQWNDVKIPVGENQNLTMTVDDYAVTFSNPNNSTDVTVSDFSLNSPIYIGSLCDFTAVATATGEFYDEIIPVLINSQSIVATAEPKGISLSSGQSTNIEWVAEFTGSTLQAGNYNLAFLTSEGQLLSQLYPVTVNAEQTTTPTMQVTSVAFPDCLGSGTANNPYILSDPDHVRAIVTITGTEGYWADNLVGEVFNTNSGRSVNQFGSAFAGVNDGQQLSVTLEGELSGLDTGTNYIFLPWGGNSGQLSNNLTYLRVDIPSGVENVAPAETTTYYTLQGIPCSNPNPGELVIATDHLGAHTMIMR